jgi:hypothetical protein
VVGTGSWFDILEKRNRLRMLEIEEVYWQDVDYWNDHG